MFYPRSGHGIEPAYIRAVLRSPTEIDAYVALAHRDGFFCSRTTEELHHLEHNGALAWIRRFESGVNDKGVRLPEALARPGFQWHEMRRENLAELVIPINFGNSIFVARLNPPAFADQRLMALARLNPEIDLALIHALLNSTIAMFIIEGIGFPRGLGALDLNKDHVEDYMHMLDPQRLSAEQTDRIRSSFAPIESRDILEVADELDQPDRQAFDNCVLSHCRTFVRGFWGNCTFAPKAFAVAPCYGFPLRRRSTCSSGLRPFVYGRGVHRLNCTCASMRGAGLRW